MRVLLIGVLSLACVVVAQGQRVEAFLRPLNTTGLNAYGETVAMSGNTIMVGDPGATVNGQQASGGVWVFERAGGLWSEVGPLVPIGRDDGDTFGRSIAIDGDIAVVGSPDTIHNGAFGRAYVFERRQGYWEQTAILYPNFYPGDDGFGDRVALEGNVAAVATERGGVYIFERASDGSWSRKVGAYYAGRGRADVGISNGRVMAASWGNGPLVFERSASLWLETASFSFSGSMLTGVMDGDRMVMGETDRATVIERIGAGWEVTAVIEPPAGQIFYFGSAMDGPLLAIGTEDGALLYEKGTGGWTQRADLRSPYGNRPNIESNPLAIQGSTVVQGNGRDSGAWVYTFDVGTQTVAEMEPRQKLDLYPNPAESHSTLRFETDIAGAVTIEVFDLLGRLQTTVFDGHLDAGTPLERELALGARGVFLVRATGPGYVRARPVLVLQ